MASTIRQTTVNWGLSAFPVALRKAAAKQDVTFDRAIKTDDGYERIERVETGVSSGRRAASATAHGDDGTQTVHGVWVSEDDFREIPESALDAVKDATQIDGIEIEEFVPLKAVPWERVEGFYYLAPLKGLVGAKPLRLLRDAMKAERVAAVVKLCLKGTTGRQRLAVIHESRGKVAVNILAFASDVRDADESAAAVANVEVNKAHLSVARELVRAMTVSADALNDGKTMLDSARDEAIAERERLYSEAVEGGDIVAPSPRPSRTVGPDNVIDQLRASLKARA